MSLCVQVIFYILLINIVDSEIYEGDDCILSSTKESSKCLSLPECPSAILEIKNGLHPQMCSFDGDTPIVCCPILSAINTTISELKCLKYAAHVPEIQILSIAGGTNSLAQQYPHMASLGYTKENRTLWLCGGSLISERFVLTAGHCVVTREYANVTWVRLGDINLASAADDSNSQDYRVIRSIRHPTYKPPSVYNDIALLELDRNVKFTSFVKPACLYGNKDIDLHTHVIATGWGTTSFGGDNSDTLQQVRLDLFTDKECMENYNSTNRKFRNGIVPEQQICAGSRNGSKDTCQGDSGGPLQTYRREDRIFTIVGVTSFGKVCGFGSIPGVYTRVSYYVPWIESVVWPNE